MNAAALPAVDTSATVLDDPVELARFSKWVDGADGRRLAESTLQVSGMTCAACAGIIETALTRTAGVHSASVSAAGERATVRWDPDRIRAAGLFDAIRAAGYDAVPDAAAPARLMRQHEHRTALWRVFVAGFCMMQVMMLATPSYVASPGDMAPDLQQLLNWGMWVLSLPVVAFAAGPFFKGAWHSVKTGRIGMDVPVAVAVLVTFVASSGAAFDPTGPFGAEVYFDSLTMFVAFLLTARYFELRARHRATGVLERSLAAMPQTALRLRDSEADERISVQRVCPGDLLRVMVGEAFAADGVITQGATRADEALLTGESTPVARGPGDTVVAGSVNIGAPVVMRVERVGADTRFEAIVSMMRDAMTQRPAAARAADRFAAPFLWTVLALSLGSAAVWMVIDPSRAVWIAVSVLIVTCPCALSLAAPATLVAAAGGLARRGILLQRLDALESLAQATHVFVDKTGTLTDDTLALTRVNLRNEGRVAGMQLREAAGELARWSSHPLARVLSTEVAGQTTRFSEVVETVGAGLQGRDREGRTWRLGSATWTGATAQGDERVWISRDGQVLAGFEFSESLRPGAMDALQAWQQEGIQVTLLSGDAEARARRMAERVGVAAVVAAASPDDKLRAVEAAQRRGETVVMIGDGVNDAPVLARADFSLAMGQGAVVSRVQSDAVVLSGRWSDIQQARQVAQRSVRIVRQNLVWAAAYNASCIPLAMLGYLPPWAAGLGMALSSLAVVANALRASN